jgi:2-hydroxychromene-2-carboxylate isomerase
MKTIELYYDFRSPYAYFASQRTSLLTHCGATLTWRPVLVSGLLNLQVNRQPGADVVDPLCAAKRAHLMADIFRLIEYWEIPFAPPNPVPPVCNDAMAVAAGLDAQGIEHSKFRDTIFAAVWQQQQDVQQLEVLYQCMQESDLDANKLESLRADGADILIANTEAAFKQGVFGVPTFVYEEQLYFGADRMELLASRL